MKKIDLGQTIGILANLSVLVGILILVIEIQQNTDQLEAQSRRSFYDNRMNANLLTVEFPHVAEMIRKSLAAEAINPLEQVQYRDYVDYVIVSWEYEVGEYLAGRLSEAELNPTGKRQFYSLIQNTLPGYWEGYRAQAPEWFTQYMEANVVQN